jgi:hypothetical protein
MKLIKVMGLFLCMAAMASCKKGYGPAEHLSAEDQYNQVYKVMRYMGRAPENVTFEERFYKGYDKHFHEQATQHRLDAYFISDDDTHYFLISRRAPSLVDKRVATGGKMKLDAEGNLLEYEEVFRTWKMADKDLANKGVMLFDLMVKGQSLEPYLTKNSWPEEYIEFPDDRTYFDVTARVWKGQPIE